MKDKIIIFIPSLNDGGAEKVAVNLSNSFSKNRRIILLTLKRNNKYRHDISKKVNIIELKSSRLILSIFQIMKVLIKERPKYLISFLYASCIISSICKILSFSNVKIIFSIHNNYERSKINTKSILTLYLFKFFLKCSYKVIVVSKGLKNQLQSKFNIPEYKIHYIYNPILKTNLLSESFKTDNSIFLFKKKKN